MASRGSLVAKQSKLEQELVGIEEERTRVLRELDKTKSSIQKIDVERQQYSWNTGEIDGEGNPVTTKTVRWKDADGNSHINPTGAREATVQTTAQRALAALVTKGLAAGTAGVANATAPCSKQHLYKRGFSLH